MNWQWDDELDSVYLLSRNWNSSRNVADTCHWICTANILIYSNWKKSTRNRSHTQTQQTKMRFIIDVLVLGRSVHRCFCLFNQTHSQCVFIAAFAVYIHFALRRLFQLTRAVCLRTAQVPHTSMISLCKLNCWNCYGATAIEWKHFPCAHHHFQFEIRISQAWRCRWKLNWSFEMSRCFRLSKLSSQVVDLHWTTSASNVQPFWKDDKRASPNREPENKKRKIFLYCTQPRQIN